MTPLSNSLMRAALGMLLLSIVSRWARARARALSHVVAWPAFVLYGAISLMGQGLEQTWSNCRIESVPGNIDWGTTGVGVGFRTLHPHGMTSPHGLYVALNGTRVTGSRKGTGVKNGHIVSRQFFPKGLPSLF